MVSAFHRLYLFSLKRLSWLLLFGGALALLLMALYFQYGMGLEPCVKCIYQRNAVWGILMAAVIGFASARWSIGRLAALGLWGLSAWWGAVIAYQHVDIQTAANPFFATCDIVPKFPSWMPLHEWLPSVFAATGSCGDIDWQFIGMSMPQWMLVIFTGLGVVWALTLISQFTPKPRS